MAGWLLVAAAAGGPRAACVVEEEAQGLCRCHGITAALFWLVALAEEASLAPGRVPVACGTWWDAGAALEESVVRGSGLSAAHLFACAQVAEAVAYMHDYAVLHRDIKPEVGCLELPPCYPWERGARGGAAANTVAPARHAGGCGLARPGLAWDDLARPGRPLLTPHLPCADPACPHTAALPPPCRTSCGWSPPPPRACPRPRG